MKKNYEILYIEDESYAFKERIKMLEDKGCYSVKPVEDVDDALEELKKKYDLILLDIMMPLGRNLAEDDVKGGYETGVPLARRIKEGTNKDTPIIVITANPDNRVEAALRKLGVSAYLKKPVDQLELEEEIEKALGG